MEDASTVRTVCRGPLRMCLLKQCCQTAEQCRPKSPKSDVHGKLIVIFGEPTAAANPCHEPPNSGRTGLFASDVPSSQHFAVVLPAVPRRSRSEQAGQGRTPR